MLIPTLIPVQTKKDSRKQIHAFPLLTGNHENINIKHMSITHIVPKNKRFLTNIVIVFTHWSVKNTTCATVVTIDKRRSCVNVSMDRPLFPSEYNVENSLALSPIKLVNTRKIEMIMP